MNDTKRSSDDSLDNTLRMLRPGSGEREMQAAVNGLLDSLSLPFCLCEVPKRRSNACICFHPRGPR